MKRLTWVLALLVFHSCKKSNDPNDLRLQRMEATDYMGNILYTEYRYDGQGRITSIIEKRNNEQSVVAVTISYNGNEVALQSAPDLDPLLTQTTEVRLTLDATGKLMKRIEFTYKVSKFSQPNQYGEFRYDTLLYEYDATGLLKKTTGSRRDSLLAPPDYKQIRQFSSTTGYTNNGGSLLARDEYVTYPYRTTQGGVTTISGGSSEYHQTFQYTKAFQNQTDFKNAVVLNEYQPYYEPPLNSNYKTMPDQVIINNLDRDMNGTVIFTSNGTIGMNRIYDEKGFLSSVIIPPGHTQNIQTNYFYGY